jgi:hypothetical protein
MLSCPGVSHSCVLRCFCCAVLTLVCIDSFDALQFVVSLSSVFCSIDVSVYCFDYLVWWASHSWGLMLVPAGGLSHERGKHFPSAHHTGYRQERIGFIPYEDVRSGRQEATGASVLQTRPCLTL